MASPAAQSVLIETHDHGLGVITLNRATRCNAFDPETMHALGKALGELSENQHIKVIQLQAAGKYFSAGADLDWMRNSIALSRAENHDDAARLDTLLTRFYHCDKPIVARIQGSAYGGALGLIACCDIAVAAKHAQFCFSEVQLGLIPAVISPYIVAAIGTRAAARYFLSAEKISATEARHLGLLHTVVSSENLDASCTEIISTLLAKPSHALAAAKQMLRYLNQTFINERTRTHSIQAIADLRVRPETQACLQAFFQRRT